MCFHAMPTSSSCMQIALGRTSGLPVLVDAKTVEVVDLAQAVAAESQGVTSNPSPHSPSSKASLCPCVGAGSPYGTTISETDAL